MNSSAKFAVLAALAAVFFTWGCEQQETMEPRAPQEQQQPAQQPTQEPGQPSQQPGQPTQQPGQ